MNKQKKSKFETLSQKYDALTKELGQLTYDLVKSIVKDAGGKIVLDFEEDDELKEIYDDYFLAVPYADEDEISIYFADSSLDSLFIEGGVLCYGLSDGRSCRMYYLPPHFTIPICEGLLEWIEVINDRDEE